MLLLVPLVFQILMGKVHPYTIVVRPKDLIFLNIMHLLYAKWQELVLYSLYIAELEKGLQILIFRLSENSIYRFLHLRNKKR